MEERGIQTVVVWNYRGAFVGDSLQKDIHYTSWGRGYLSESVYLIECTYINCYFCSLNLISIMCGACSNATIQYREAALSYDSTGIKADMIIAIEI